MTDSKGELFGKVVPTNAPGGFEVDLEIIKREFADAQSVVRVFCRGCGLHVEILPQGAEDLLGLAKAEKPFSWSGVYFESEKCLFCATFEEGQNFSGVKLQSI